jgi:hypothetical protein
MKGMKKSQKPHLLMFLRLTTKMVQTAMVTEMLVGAYKRHLWVHTSSNGTRGRLG